jgi:hypothetical protein
MTVRTLLTVGAVLVVAFVGLVWIPLTAQQPATPPTTVKIVDGTIRIDEVRVGGSCVVVVFRDGGAGSDLMDAVPCGAP